MSQAVETVLVRSAQAEDIDGMVALLTELFRMEDDVEINDENMRKGLLALLGRDDACVLVAEFDGTLVGMVTGQTFVSTSAGAPAVYIEDMIVNSRARGLGVGQALMKQMEDWGRSIGADRMHLLVDAGNHGGIRFYESTGWTETPYRSMKKRL